VIEDFSLPVTSYRQSVLFSRALQSTTVYNSTDHNKLPIRASCVRCFILNWPVRWSWRRQR